MPVQSDFFACGIILDSAVSFYKLALKISKHYCQLVHVAHDTVCKYGALVGGKCGSSFKYPSTEYVRIHAPRYGHPASQFC